MSRSCGYKEDDVSDTSLYTSGRLTYVVTQAGPVLVHP